LQPSPCADGYADRWAVNLSTLGSLVHQAMSPILSACGASRVGENVAYGNVTPEQLVTMWMGSTGHRANILNAGYTHVGVGAVRTATGRVYGVQVFVTA
ncbi:MAG: CAP domain-containing protein, partial [Frankiaceae bacterium]|nr:CAP domain-containing protein [Frankiaceae bacterium]